MKNKEIISIILTLIFLIIILSIGIIYHENNKEPKIRFSEEVFSFYPEPLYKALYQYTNSDKSFKDYFDSLDNSEKLYVGGIIISLSESKYESFTNIVEKLKYIFDSNLNVEPKDYYPFKEEEEPFLKYNDTTNSYEYNEYYPPSSFSTSLKNTEIYNYKLKEIKYKRNKAFVTYYGLYKVNDSFFSKLTNNSNIERVLEAEELMEYTETDKEFLTNLYDSNKDDLLVFEYEFTLKDDNYYLTDFKIIE